MKYTIIIETIDTQKTLREIEEGELVTALKNSFGVKSVKVKEDISVERGMSVLWLLNDLNKKGLLGKQFTVKTIFELMEDKTVKNKSYDYYYKACKFLVERGYLRVLCHEEVDYTVQTDKRQQVFSLVKGKQQKTKKQKKK